MMKMHPEAIFAGIVLGKNGERDYHLFLLPIKPAGRMTWESAKAWAISVGGELPTLRELSILFANRRENFAPTWYWSGESYAHYDDCAWLQYFDNGGGQNLNRSSGECQACAVIRVYPEAA